MTDIQRPKPVVLLILDGWGIAPVADGNALAKANTPRMRELLQNYPAMTLSASGTEVGLLWGENGNSEVGHLNIGAGRVYYQTFPRINKSIDDKSFFANPVFNQIAGEVTSRESAVHLVGLVSRGNVHSSLDHLFALLAFCKSAKITNVFVHAILDGRDTTYNAGLGYVEELEKKMKEFGVGSVASISGRYFAMDRDNRWDRVEKAYRAIVEGTSELKDTNAAHAVQSSYDKKVYDEEFEPTVIVDADGQSVGAFHDGDGVIFFNFRPDRMREITRAVSLPAFEKFERNLPKELVVGTMTEFEQDLPVLVAFAPEVIGTCLAKVVADAGLKQLHIAETEKYAHVTFFLNGTREEPFPKEDRVIIPSPRVSSYDQKPEMSAREITAAVMKEINADSYDFIAMNFANVDMVAHVGKLDPTIKAAEVVDECIGKIVDAVRAKNGVVFITADHGNAEELSNLHTGDIDKEHSTNPVPFIAVGPAWEKQPNDILVAVGGDLSMIPSVGMLADVAPTVLQTLGLSIPAEMTGRPLV